MHRKLLWHGSPISRFAKIAIFSQGLRTPPKEAPSKCKLNTDVFKLHARFDTLPGVAEHRAKEEEDRRVQVENERDAERERPW